LTARDTARLLVQPDAAGGVTMSVYCVVPDADAHFAQAKSAGGSLAQCS
jgi:uncharacterized glyoxalase superfamily protein PhnB